MLACARLGAVHSVVFGGFAPNELAVRIDDARPKVVVTASCGIEPTRVVEYKPIVDRALERAEHQPDVVIVKQRPQVEGRDAGTARRRLGRRHQGGHERPGRVRRGEGHRPALRALHLGHHRQAEGHRARQRRARGGDGVVAAEHLRRPRGPGLVDRVRRRVGGRPLLHRLRAADQRRHHGALRGQARRHAGRRRVLAGDRRARRRLAVHGAHRDPRDQEGGPGRQAARGARPERVPHAVPRRRAAGPGDLPLVDRAAGRAGGRPLVADRDRLADRGEPPRPRPDGDQAGLADGAGAGLPGRGPRRARQAGRRPAWRARSACGCRCRRGR